MSKGLFDARRKLSGVGAMLKQDKIANAVQVLHSGLQDMLRQPLLKSERSEFTQILDNAVREINGNRKLQQQFNIMLTYVPGEENNLLEAVRLLMETLDSLALEEADKAYREREARKRAAFEKGIGEIAAGDLSAGRNTFSKLASEWADDVSLMVDISEAFEKVSQVNDAIIYMEKARQYDSKSAYILNRLGILYRKAGKYEDSEKMFQEAEDRTPDDPFLQFNKGRLYVDWQKWPQAVEAGESALSLQPEFSEAQKLVDYAKKRA